MINWFSKFLKNEEAQATTEYVLLMAVSVGLFLVFKRILGPIITRLSNAASMSIQNQLIQNLERHPPFRFGH